MLRLLFTEEFLRALEGWSGHVGAPAKDHRATPGLQVFRNPFVERYLASAHPLFPGTWAIPLSILLLLRAFEAGLGPAELAGATVGGALCWSLLEYVLHRFLFHRVPRPDSSPDRLGQYLMHGYHHDYPQDERRLVAPLLLVVPIAIPVAVAWRVTAGPVWWMPLFAGTVLGYLAYDWMHWYTHHAVPTGVLGRWLRRLHAIHHYKRFDQNMGISSPLWDRVLGTYLDKPRRRAARPRRH